MLLNGKTILVNSVEIRDHGIAYRKVESQTGKNKKSKLRFIHPDRVFSVRFSDGREQVVFEPDTLDPLEFSVSQMRMFIKGEQDAAMYYKNDLNKVLAVGVGAGAGILGFYGLVIPPLYSTVVGSYSPNLDKRLRKQIAAEEAVSAKVSEMDSMKVSLFPEAGSEPNELQKEYQKTLDNYGKSVSFSDKSLVIVPEYREGYERKARDRKIRNALLGGLSGFAAFVVAFNIIL